jgi:hypothetical protein
MLFFIAITAGIVALLAYFLGVPLALPSAPPVNP